MIKGDVRLTDAILNPLFKSERGGHHSLLANGTLVLTLAQSVMSHRHRQ